MGLKIALAGNPNSGKSTLFNNLTGSKQYVGNWPGVTVEKKEGAYKKDSSISFIDLPGIYSLSPYTLEEVVTRDYLVNESPDVIINIVDATNIERNLYLSTQLSELGIPMVIALNMMDVVRKNKDKIDKVRLSKLLGFPVIEISALKNENISELIEVARTCGTCPRRDTSHMKVFEPHLESIITSIENNIKGLCSEQYVRWHAIKLFEEDVKVKEKLNLSNVEKERISQIITDAKKEYDDDGEGIITDARYNYISDVISETFVRGRTGLTPSDKIDQVVTNRYLAIPIFVVIMSLIYKVSIDIVGGGVTDWVNDVFFVEFIGGNLRTLLENFGVAEWLVSLVIDGIVAGVGGVLGFLPIIVTLYFFIAILEDIGYMSRIAFILDKIFRRFGLSGKSFIPILIGTGCSVPGIMATRTIESENDRRMTIIVSSFLPCGAKTEIIALFAASLFVGRWWFGPVFYFTGILAVIISGLILKKTRIFQGSSAPFVMELPEYHIPSAYNVFKSVFDRSKSFVIKAGTVILLATIFIWFGQNISVHGEFLNFANDSTDSILAAVGKIFAPIFAPLGFGNWMATVATALGFVAKEAVVSTYGVVAGVNQENLSLLEFVSANFTIVSAMSFTLFNQLNIPCAAAVGAIKQEMNSKKWTIFALAYQTGFAYAMSLMVYQFGRVLILGEPVNIWTGIAGVILAIFIYLLFRKDRSKLKYKEVESNI